MANDRDRSGEAMRSELAAASPLAPNHGAVLREPPAFRSSTDRLAPIRRRPSQENPSRVLRGTWRSPRERFHARRSRRRFYAGRAFAGAQPRLPPDHTWPDRSAAGARVALLP